MNRKSRRAQERDEKIKLRREKRKEEKDWVYEWFRIKRALRQGAHIGKRVIKREIYKRDRGRCQLCGNRVSLKSAVLDHIVPLSRGGAHAEWNVQIAHDRCDKKKGSSL